MWVLSRERCCEWIRHVQSDKSFVCYTQVYTCLYWFLSDKTALIVVAVVLSVLILVLIGIIVYLCVKMKRYALLIWNYRFQDNWFPNVIIFLFNINFIPSFDFKSHAHLFILELVDISKCNTAAIKHGQLGVMVYSILSLNLILFNRGYCIICELELGCLLNMCRLLIYRIVTTIILGHHLDKCCILKKQSAQEKLYLNHLQIL